MGFGAGSEELCCAGFSEGFFLLELRSFHFLVLLECEVQARPDPTCPLQQPYPHFSTLLANTYFQALSLNIKANGDPMRKTREVTI